MKIKEKYIKIINNILNNTILPRGYNTKQFIAFINILSLLKLEIPPVNLLNIPRGGKTIIDHYNENTRNFDTYIEGKSPNTIERYHYCTEHSPVKRNISYQTM